MIVYDIILGDGNGATELSSHTYEMYAGSYN